MVASSEIDERIERLREDYGEFPVERTTTEVSGQSAERVRDLHERGLPGGARVWVESGDESLLVREANGPAGWGVPGGLIEPGERADRAGEREVVEETAVSCTVEEVAYVHRATRDISERDAVEEVAVAFVATASREDPRPESGEIDNVAWFDAPPDDLRSPATRIGPERLDW
jgi:ADP-ribose pyrophosphatase YjhB (NUDIX family)